MEVPAAAGVTSCVPEGACVPLQAPLAWHAAALELDQVSVVDWPTLSAVGLAPMLTMTGLPVAAAGAEDAFPLPPPPPQEASSTHAAATASRKQVHTREPNRALTGGL